LTADVVEKGFLIKKEFIFFEHPARAMMIMIAEKKGALFHTCK
jgi:hypothetical protein